MFLTRISVSQPVFATMVMLAIMVFGFVSYSRLPIEQLPNVDFPIVAVVVSYPGASPEAVESDIAQPIEEALNTLSGIETIQSTSQSGQVLVIAQFDLDIDSQTAAQNVRDALSPVQAALPANAGDAQVLRFDPSALPVLSLAVSSPALSQRDLTTLAEDVIVPRLSTISGVGRATIVGGVPTRLNILLDSDRLNAFNVTVGQVVQAVGAENQNLPAGQITSGASVRTLQVEGRMQEMNDFLDIVVANQAGQPVYLRDVATIEDGQADVESLALLNGQRAIAIDIVMTQGANTVSVAEQLRVAVASLSETLPEDTVLEIVRDNAVPVEDSFHAVQNMILEGALLAIVIVFVFLNSWRSTVITATTLPIALLGTMIVLYFLGFTLNILTMMALSLSIGILIDDAIVVRESIMRHLHMGKSHMRAALEGTKEIGLAVLATTLALVAVFMPVAFMEGIMGRFFLQFGVTVSVAVLISLFVAFTLDPMLSSVWHDPHANPNAKRGPIGRFVGLFDVFFQWLTRGYRRLVRWTLRFRKTTLALVASSFVSIFFLFPYVGVEFMPPTDNNEVQVTVETPLGSSIDYTASKVRQLDRTLRELPGVVGTYSTLNAGTTSGDNRASVVVQLTGSGERELSAMEMATPIRRALEAIPGASFLVSAGDGFGGGATPISITIYGESFDVLERLGDTLVAGMSQIDGLIDIETSLDDVQPVLGVRVDRALASDLGVSLQQVGAALEPMIAGQDVSEWTSPDGRSYTVTVRLPESARQDVATLGSLPIAQAANGEGMIALDQVAEIVASTGPGEILRQDLARQVTITANIEGVDLGAVTGTINQLVAGLDLPPGYTTGFGGDLEQLADIGVSAGSALLLAVVLIYFVIASQFGSFLQPLAIMVSLPLSLVGVMIGLIVGGSTLNMFSIIGFIMLMGLVVKNAILLVDNANQHVRDGWNLFDALVEAGTIRFRPIIMTTLAMIFGMLPLALNLHEGSSQNAPMAHAVIGGLISSTILTLVVVPVILTYVEGFGRMVGRFMPKPPDDHEADVGHGAIEGPRDSSDRPRHLPAPAE